MRSQVAPSGARRGLVGLGWVMSLLAVAGLSWWAGSVTLAPPPSEEPVIPVLTVRVGEGTLGRSLTVPVNAWWELTPLAVAAGEGVVTSIEIADGTQVGVGDRLLTVNLRPVIAAQGTVPAFRDLGQESSGADVLQLQQFLATLGHYEGPLDSEFGSGVAAGVRAWQKSLGLPETGIVTASDLVFIPTLPARVVLAGQIGVGSRLAPGESLLQLVDSAPMFRAILNETQMTIVGADAPATVIAGETRWEALIGETHTDLSNGTVYVELGAPGGGVVCGDECANTVPVYTDGTLTTFSAELVVMPDTSGAMVPSSAVVTDPSGQAIIVLPDGTRKPVDVLAAQDGQSIVTGVDVGTTILTAPSR